MVRGAILLDMLWFGAKPVTHEWRTQLVFSDGRQVLVRPSPDRPSGRRCST